MSPSSELPPVPPPEKPPVRIPPPMPEPVEEVPPVPPTPEPTPAPELGDQSPVPPTERPPVALGSSTGETLKDSRNMSFFGRLISKVEIGYAQWRADSHEKKAVELKQEVDSFGIKANTLDQTKRDIISVAEDLKRQGMPGSEALMLKLKKIDRQKDEILAKKDRVQTKFEERQNKVKGYTNERDVVAKKLIEHYDAKLEPMEKKLELLDSQKNELDLIVTVTEIKQRARAEDLQMLEEKKSQIERGLRSTGISEREMKKYTKPLEEALVSGREEMRKEKEKLAKQRAELDARIAEADKKANPYRDEREEFVRVTKDRPIGMNVKPRKRGEASPEHEEIRPLTREPETQSGQGWTESTRARNIILPGGEDLPAGGFAAEGGAPTPESREKRDERPKLEEIGYAWNFFCDKDPLTKQYQIDGNEFMKMTKLLPDFRLNTTEFMKVLRSYFKTKRQDRRPSDRVFTAASTDLKKVFKEKA